MKSVNFFLENKIADKQDVWSFYEPMHIRLWNRLVPFAHPLRLTKKIVRRMVINK